MKLTKEERFTAYVIMLAELESGKWEFYCHIIEFVFGFPCNRNNDSLIRELFPELWVRKPKNASVSWFDPMSYGAIQRPLLLKECINELGNELYSNN